MGLDGLRRHQREIDDLNVYPVPDGDTGTNLVLTVAAADEALALEADALASLGHALRCAARGALLGARGNSGVILSQILRGLADALAAAPLAGGRALATALATASSAAYQAVAQPVEGTILTVVRAAAQAAAAADSDDLATETAVAPLKQSLAKLGDSLVVVGGDGTWNVHVHVNDVGAAVEAGVEAGRPHRITVTRFADQQAPAPAPVPAVDHTWASSEEPGGARGVVVVAGGEGLTELFEAEGATVISSAAAAPSTAEILAGIKASGARFVVILPTDPNVAAAAAAAAAEAREAGIQAGVVPSRSPVQALAALAVRDEARRFDDDVIAMAEAVGACRYAEVTTASREAITVAGRCQPGDILGLVDGEVNLIGKDLTQTCRLLLDRLLAGGGELVTLVTGAQAPPELVDALVSHLGERWQFVEVQTYHGGQPHYPLLIGVE